MALTGIAPRGKMEAQNSWESENKNWEVSADNFVSAVTLYLSSNQR